MLWVLWAQNAKREEEICENQNMCVLWITNQWFDLTLFPRAQLSNTNPHEYICSEVYDNQDDIHLQMHLHLMLWSLTTPIDIFI